MASAAAAIPQFHCLTTVEAFRKSVNEHFAKQIEEGNYDPNDLKRFNEVDGYTKMFIEHGQYGPSFIEPRALKIFNEAMGWRKENAAFDVAPGQFPANYFERHGIFYQNRDLQNCRLLHFAIRTFNKGQEDNDAVKRFIIYNFEEQIRNHPGERITILFDMSETGLRHLDYDLVKFIMNLLIYYYPGLLSYMMVYRLPFILQAAWKIIKSWLPTETVNSVKFVDQKTITQYVAQDQLSLAMGGTDEKAL